MNYIIQNIIPYLILYKYLTIFIIAFAAAFIVPVPSGSILIAASAFASIGYFNLFWVITISILGNIIGDNLGYFVARKYGKEVLSRVGFRRIFESKNYMTIESKFSKHSGAFIFISRFEVISTLSVNLLSGISRIPYRKFLIHELTGSVAQVCMYSLVGYFFADSWQSVNSTIGVISFLAILTLVILLVVFGKRKMMNKLD